MGSDMKHPDKNLLTPVYVKTDPDMPWPKEEKMFYLLTADGLFIGRNHRFFTSCVPTENWPQELAPQKRFLRLSMPKIPRPMMEQVIGFFDCIGKAHSAEAAVLVAWDEREKRIRVIVPDQVATVSVSWSGHAYPMDVHYEIPKLDEGLTLIGDIHSHVDDAAYASYMDKQDETHSAGVHIVVGRISREPPEFHIEATVDGVRFLADPALVLGGYKRRNLDVPKAWIEKVKVVPWGEYQKQKTAIEISNEGSSRWEDAPASSNNSSGLDSKEIE